jgi:hypothetical protein
MVKRRSLKMPLRKIDDNSWINVKDGGCRHPEHNPPTHIYLEPGTYEYICPACGHKQVFSVPGFMF